MRHFLFHAFRASTCALLLAGCDYPVAPVPPQPERPAPPISIEIAGPGRIDASGAFTWQAIVFGGSGNYRYQWGVASQGGQQPSAPTAAQTLSLRVSGTDGDMSLKVIVSSGDQTQAQSFAVRNCINGCAAAQ